MIQTALAITAALAFILTVGASAPTVQGHGATVVSPADAHPVGPI